MEPMTSTCHEDERGVFDEPRIQTLLIELSKAFIHDAFDGRTDSCVGLLDPDVLWLGPFQGETQHGVAGFCDLCDKMKERGYRAILIHQTYEIASVYPESCCVVARASLYIGVGGRGPVLSKPLRVVFHWRLQSSNSVRITALEATLPLEGDFPRIDANRKPDIELGVLPWDMRIELKDDQGITHFVDKECIQYVEARA